ncbi:hypothetical protein PoB_001500800 [Plakobranchus ocellatus]|uniref:Uncharacterized protein n=1 Tax=Plakobranchus ocellatus TaxID=259542 RepID=A0AAV3Z159_9GAST|nr:hypothetical protein PoB_001500800 [Plakobranchus ocellatus]
MRFVFKFDSRASRPIRRPTMDTHCSKLQRCARALWSYTFNRECETSTGIDLSPTQRKLTSIFSFLTSMGHRCPPVSGEGNSQGAMLMSDESLLLGRHQLNPQDPSLAPYGRTSRQTMHPHCGHGPLNYFQH